MFLLLVVVCLFVCCLFVFKYSPQCSRYYKNNCEVEFLNKICLKQVFLN